MVNTDEDVRNSLTKQVNWVSMVGVSKDHSDVVNRSDQRIVHYAADTDGASTEVLMLAALTTVQ